uniref:Major facilitator superfamily domain-containing protein 5 n=1 Tax=Onchocerca volvulus TaxID=6282 RepID=A0A8R1TZK0_ONCVO
MFFEWSFYALSVICIIQYFYTRNKNTTSQDPTFRQFEHRYLLVYLLATTGDWLQGPHVYALYYSYGMTKHEIELLFVAGFSSSLVGRRLSCLLYAILYAGTCVAKHFANFWILFIGRIFGGMATSILCTAFESWLVCEHNKRGFNPDSLKTIFSHAALANSIVAIISGLVAHYSANAFGYVTPFDISLVVLVVMMICAIAYWTENYGCEKTTLNLQFMDAYRAMRNDWRVVCLALIQSLFEGTLYLFVLEWTPALSDASGALIPHGYIFASFMVSIMIGSTIFRLLSKHQRPESFMRFVLAVSVLCLVTPIIWPYHAAAIFAAFVFFEICVGIFWPAIGFMRGIYIPDTTRATIMNFSRVPLNAVNLLRQTIFQCCVMFLVFATAAQQYLYRIKIDDKVAKSELLN